MSVVPRERSEKMSKFWLFPYGYKSVAPKN